MKFCIPMIPVKPVHRRRWLRFKTGIETAFERRGCFVCMKTKEAEFPEPEQIRES